MEIWKYQARAWTLQKLQAQLTTWQNVLTNYRNDREDHERRRTAPAGDGWFTRISRPFYKDLQNADAPSELTEFVAGIENLVRLKGEDDFDSVTTKSKSELLAEEARPTVLTGEK